MEVFTNRESVERIVFAIFHYLPVCHASRLVTGRNVNRDDTPLKEFTYKDWHYRL